MEVETHKIYEWTSGRQQQGCTCIFLKINYKLNENLRSKRTREGKKFSTCLLDYACNVAAGEEKICNSRILVRVCGFLKWKKIIWERWEPCFTNQIGSFG